MKISNVLILQRKKLAFSVILVIFVVMMVFMVLVMGMLLDLNCVDGLSKAKKGNDCDGIFHLLVFILF